MGSKKKADVTPDCHEHANPPKKRKLDGPIESLLLEVENQNVANMKYLFEQGLDSISPGNFPLSEQWRLVFIHSNPQEEVPKDQACEKERAD
jgi:hypothetical protein